MLHIHIYLHKKLPFVNITALGDGEVAQYEKYKFTYKGSDMYEFPECKVCSLPQKHKIYCFKR